MASKPALMTADELLALGDIGRSELIRGELVRMSPSGFEHATVAAEICAILRDYVRKQRLGLVTTAEGGFRIARDPDTVRAPDVGFVATARLPAVPRRGFFEGAPDLAVEVISPDDRWSEVVAKANAWLEAGAAAVWILDPPNRTVTVYQPQAASKVLRDDEVLDGDAVVPGFAVPVRDLFPG